MSSLMSRITLRCSLPRKYLKETVLKRHSIADEATSYSRGDLTAQLFKQLTDERQRNFWHAHRIRELTNRRACTKSRKHTLPTGLLHRSYI